jgi:hypothetical protein
METKHFTLLELLQARTWLLAVMSSTRSFVHVEVSKEQIEGGRKRLKEIDEELVARLMEYRDPEPGCKVFEDNNFEQTLEELKITEEE